MGGPPNGEHEQDCGCAAAGSRFGRRARRGRRGCDERRPDFRGRLRQARAPLRGADDGRHRRLDRFDDQSGNWRLRYATSRARQAVAGYAHQDRSPPTREADGARGLRRRRQSEDAARARRHHSQASSYPHLRLLLRLLERRHHALSGENRNACDHLLRERRAERAANLRPWREMGIRRQHRLRR